MGRQSITHVRAYKEDVADFRKEMGNIPSADIIRVAWRQYKTVQKMGRFVYGNVWKRPTKK